MARERNRPPVSLVGVAGEVARERGAGLLRTSRGWGQSVFGRLSAQPRLGGEHTRAAVQNWRAKSESSASRPPPAAPCGSTSTTERTTFRIRAGPAARLPSTAGKVYFLGAEGDLTCLEAADGRVVWSKRLDRGVQDAHALLGSFRPSAGRRRSALLRRRRRRKRGGRLRQAHRTRSLAGPLRHRAGLLSPDPHRARRHEADS